MAPSYVDAQTIWAGTDDGLIHVTRDGGRTWNNVTPPELKPWMKVSLIDASRFDASTAYAAINTFRLDDLRPHIYKTTDGGRSWTHITTGIPDGGVINAVREDPKRRGLLFAGSEQAVYVSFDDGAHWQSLRINMPATSIRDLVVKDDDPRMRLARSCARGERRGPSSRPTIPGQGEWSPFRALAFDADGDTALVNMGFVCGDLCGSGGFYLLVKEEGTWKVQQALMEWIS